MIKSTNLPMKEEFRFADLHCHPNLKTYGHTFDSCSPGDKCDVWYYRPPGFMTRLVNIIAGITRFSQSDFTTLSKGGSKIIVASLYPFEKGFFINSAGKGPLSAWLSDLITGIGYRRVRNLQEHTDYFRDLEHEYRFFAGSRQTAAVEGREYNWKLAACWEDVRRALEKENETAVIISIEGAHVFNTGLEAFGRRVPEDEVISNIRQVKAWDYPPLFITFAHNFYNGLCGHARSLEPIKRFVDQSHNVDTGFTSLGERVLRELLSKDSGRRIFIDIKHMSLASRKDYFRILERDYTGDIPPTIVSHGAVNGLSWEAGSVVSSESPFYPSDINFFDEEIEYIDRSEGLFAIQFDARRIAREDMVRKSFRSLCANVDADRAARMIWNQVEHIAGVLDRAGLPAWGAACIGSDYDGTIDPLPGVWTAEYFPVLREPLIELASSYLRRPDRLTMAENRDITAEEVVERFFIGNTVEFLRKFF